MPGTRGLLVAGRYRLGETIGQGGMGRVWRAADEILDRQVAVKEMRINELDAEDSRIRRERTLREARATARIDHPNVVRVYDVVAEESDRLWIVMELVESRSLEKLLLEDGPVSPREAARIGVGLAAALVEVHAVGVLHRDIKPGNVLLGPGGRVVLTDFGIAAIQDAAALTVVGMLVGSPDYMAPERVAGKPQGPASDVWSLGATLCAAVGGRSPFSRPSTLATLHAVLYEEPELPEAAGPLGPLLAQLLVKDPELRPGLAETATRLMPIAAPPTVLAAGPTGVPHPPTVQVFGDPPPWPGAVREQPPPPPPPREVPPSPEPVPEEPRPAPRRRGWTRARIVVVAALVVAAAVTAVLIAATADQHLGGGSGGSSSAAPPTVAGTARPPSATPPPGSINETGFAWIPPKDWTRTAKSPSNVHYHAPDGKQEIAASYALARGGDLMTQWQEAEAGSHDVPGYHKIRLARTTFHGQPAIIWDYDFTQNGVPWKARQLGFDEGGKSYQINTWYEADTESAALGSYEAVTSSFTPL
ncbi:serine/threonine protein kinase [Streptomyces sp. SDr-06]|nr:serine/threonine-protein kinase [Streptomyces sp. SDr-06]RCH68676.1 serine/threonine protein kinase [Streptomyces sp. SDr-06]